MKFKSPNRLRKKKGKWDIYYNEAGVILMPDRRKQIDKVKVELESLEELNYRNKC